jgi:hypothetical protein
MELLCQSNITCDPFSGLTTDTPVKRWHIQPEALCGMSQALGRELLLVRECPIV